MGTAGVCAIELACGLNRMSGATQRSHICPLSQQAVGRCAGASAPARICRHSPAVRLPTVLALSVTILAGGPRAMMRVARRPGGMVIGRPGPQSKVRS